MAVTDDAVFALTGKGEQQLRGGHTTLDKTALELLVGIDGAVTVAQLRKRFPGIPGYAVDRTLATLIEDGYLGPAAEVNDDLGLVDFFSKDPIKPPGFAPSAAVDREASDGVTSLQQQGYYVRIARPAAGAAKPAEGAKPTVLIIEDEELMAKFLRRFLLLDGIESRIAGNRAEILAELRRQPLPDLLLLDVMLPDADGFDVLHKIRQHPLLKKLPVIMLTAKATREAVLKGLALGADGYVTKPFEAEVVSRAVRNVLGLDAA